MRRARELIRGRDLDVWLQVDGGVNAETIERCAEAGADVFVAGSAVYSAADPAEAVRALRRRAAVAVATPRRLRRVDRGLAVAALAQPALGDEHRQVRARLGGRQHLVEQVQVVESAARAGSR